MCPTCLYIHLESMLDPPTLSPSSGIRIILISSTKTILISTLEFRNTQKQYLIWILGGIGLPNLYPNFVGSGSHLLVLKYPILRFNPIRMILI